MKLLKLSVEGLPQFEKGLEVEFVAQQRVDDVDREMLYCVFPTYMSIRPFHLSVSMLQERRRC